MKYFDCFWHIASAVAPFRRRSIGSRFDEWDLQNPTIWPRLSEGPAHFSQPHSEPFVVVEISFPPAMPVREGK